MRKRIRPLVSVALFLAGSRWSGCGIRGGSLVSHYRPIPVLIGDIIDNLGPTVRQQHVIGSGRLHILPHLVMPEIQTRRRVHHFVRKFIVRRILIIGTKEMPRELRIAHSGNKVDVANLRRLNCHAVQIFLFFFFFRRYM